jgi:DNA (cytosine-5)-methyltransferase 1
LDAQYFGVPQRRRRVFVVGYLGDWRFAAAVLFERESLRGNPKASPKEKKDIAKCLTRGIAQRLDPETETMIAFAQNSRDEIRFEGGHGKRTGALSHGGGKPGQGYPAVVGKVGVRRLTPTECERLQGFSDGHTLVIHRGRAAADGPRYKALGNSMAVPVMRWIGKRIAEVERILVS